MEMKNKNIYVMISATGTKISRLVRIVTKATYGHASISFDPEMKQLYSFGRFYHCMPFIGGLVNETMDRFTLNSPRHVKIMVFKIPVTEEAYSAGIDRIYEIASDDEYAYNLVSAATFCVKHGVSKYKTFTCSEFVSHMLRIMRPDLASPKEDCKVVPNDYVELLKDYKIYEGNLCDYDKFIAVKNEEYFKKISFGKRHRKTLKFLRSRYLHYTPVHPEEAK